MQCDVFVRKFRFYFSILSCLLTAFDLDCEPVTLQKLDKLLHLSFCKTAERSLDLKWTFSAVPVGCPLHNLYEISSEPIICAGKPVVCSLTWLFLRLQLVKYLLTLIGSGNAVGFAYVWTVVRKPVELFTVVYRMHSINELLVFVSEVLPLVEFVLEDGIR